MTLIPAPSDVHYREVSGVRVYMDDVALLASNLRTHGPVVVEVSHVGGSKSHVEDPLSLVGRSDIWQIDVRIAIPDRTRLMGFAVPISVDIDRGLCGLRATVDQAGPILQVFDHFAGQLETVPRLGFWGRLRHRNMPKVDLIFDTRQSVWMETRRRAFEIRIAVIGAVVGAAIGAAATLITIWL